MFTRSLRPLYRPYGVHVRAFRLVAAPPDVPSLPDHPTLLTFAPPRVLLSLPPPCPPRLPEPEPVIEEIVEEAESVEQPVEPPQTSWKPSWKSSWKPSWEPSWSIPSLASLSSSISDTCRKRTSELRGALADHGREFALNTAKNLTLLSMKVNEVTGYREVERLKLAVKEREHDLNLRRTEAKAAKSEYEHAVLDRTTSQQNVNTLLERKHAWTDSDVAEFTRLVRSDHASRHAVSTTSQDMKAAEIAVDKAFSALMQAILERYHEEQVWSDKIRSVATWANIVALAANLIVFVGAIAFVEPWKRRRLVQGLEERMTGMMDRVEGELQGLSAQVAKLEPVAAVLPVEGAAMAEVGAAPAVEEKSESELAGEPAEPSEPVLPDRTTSADVEIPALSPLEQLAGRVSPDSQEHHALTWVSAQLAQVAPPSVERDLAAASLVGAVSGAVVLGLLSAIIRGLRG